MERARGPVCVCCGKEAGRHGGVYATVEWSAEFSADLCTECSKAVRREYDYLKSAAKKDALRSVRIAVYAPDPIMDAGMPRRRSRPSWGRRLAFERDKVRGDA